METINVTEIILETINSLFSNLFSSIDNSLYPILDDLTFIDTTILNENYLENILGSSAQDGILLLCNSLLIGFILYYSISSFLSHLTLSSTQHPLQFIFRLIIFTILMNCSFFFCEQLISINSLISSSIRNLGETLFNKNICFSGLIEELNSTISIGKESLNIFSIDGLIKGFISFGLFNLIFSFSLRYILLKVFILLSPFAIITLILDKSAWFFRSWFRSFLSLLFLQDFVSIILLVTFSIDYSNDTLSKLLYVGSIYTLIKANSFVQQLVGGITANIQNGLHGFKSIFMKGG